MDLDSNIDVSELVTLKGTTSWLIPHAVTRMLVNMKLLRYLNSVRLRVGLQS